MTKHPTDIHGFRNVEQAAEFVSRLRYDKLRDFFRRLELKLATDSRDDGLRGRPKLARHLYMAAGGVGTATYHIDRAWAISEPYMDTSPGPDYELRDGRWVFKPINEHDGTTKHRKAVAKSMKGTK